MSLGTEDTRMPNDIRPKIPHPEDLRDVEDYLRDGFGVEVHEFQAQLLRELAAGPEIRRTPIWRLCPKISYGNF